MRSMISSMNSSSQQPWLVSGPGLLGTIVVASANHGGHSIGAQEVHQMPRLVALGPFRFHVTGFSNFQAAWEKFQKIGSSALPVDRVVVFPWPISGLLPSTAKLRAATNGCRLDGGHTTKAEVVQFEALTATRLTCLWGYAGCAGWFRYGLRYSLGS